MARRRPNEGREGGLPPHASKAKRKRGAALAPLELEKQRAAALLAQTLSLEDERQRAADERKLLAQRAEEEARHQREQRGALKVRSRTGASVAKRVATRAPDARPRRASAAHRRVVTPTAPRRLRAARSQSWALSGRARRTCAPLLDSSSPSARARSMAIEGPAPRPSRPRSHRVRRAPRQKWAASLSTRMCACAPRDASMCAWRHAWERRTSRARSGAPPCVHCARPNKPPK